MSSKKALLFIVVITSFILMTYQSKKGHFGPIKSINFVLDSTHMVVSSLTDSLFRPFRRLALREEENIKLKKRVDALLLERDNYQDAAIENKRLRELLTLKENS